MVGRHITGAQLVLSEMNGGSKPGTASLPLAFEGCSCSVQAKPMPC